LLRIVALPSQGACVVRRPSSKGATEIELVVSQFDCAKRPFLMSDSIAEAALSAFLMRSAFEYPIFWNAMIKASTSLQPRL
jgi:hypothetical protein